MDCELLLSAELHFIAMMSAKNCSRLVESGRAWEIAL